MTFGSLFTNPMTTLNDIIVGLANGVATRLAIGANTFPARSSAGNIAAKPITDAALTVLDDATVAAMVDTLGGAASTGTNGIARATSPVLATPDINAGTVDSLTSLSVRDTSAAFDVTVKATSSTALSAGRTLTIDVDNAARTVKLGGNLTLPAAATISGTSSGTNTGDNITATTSTAGILKLVDQAMMETATDTSNAVVAGMQKFHPGHPKGWVNFIGTGTVTINKSYNVTSITDGGTGVYTVVWATDFSAAEYCLTTNGATLDNGVAWVATVINDTGGLAAASALLSCKNTENTTLTDSPVVCVAGMGDQ
jgi:hypothetical protein